MYESFFAQNSKHFFYRSSIYSLYQFKLLFSQLMLSRSSPRLFLSSLKALSSSASPPPPSEIQANEPGMPWHFANQSFDKSKIAGGGITSKLFDTGMPLMHEHVRGATRWAWQEPAKYHYNVVADDCVALEEHDMEEFNEQPYCTVNHLYEPPQGSEDNPLRIEIGGMPGDIGMLRCMGNCAPHVPQATWIIPVKGYSKNQCPMCHQWMYIHNRSQLLIHPDWTEDPASDEGPQFKFSEVESEFDRCFHDFAFYLNLE